jgi:hypothetical protein
MEHTAYRIEVVRTDREYVALSETAAGTQVHGNPVPTCSGRRTSLAAVVESWLHYSAGRG